MAEIYDFKIINFMLGAIRNFKILSILLNFTAGARREI